MLINIPDDERPMCPNSSNRPHHPAHQLHNQVLDAFSSAAEHDANGEMIEPVGKAYHAAAYGQVSDRMYLFREGVSVLEGNRPMTVEAWWFRCLVCGLVLPAQPRETRRP